MKKLLFVVAAMLFALVACQKEDDHGGNTNSASNAKKILGEWTATKIAVVGGVVITDYDRLADELDGLEWITVTEKHIRLMDTEYEVLLPYELSGNKLVFQGGESDSTYELVSVSDSNMIIKYSNGYWTSNIYYKKVR